MTRSFTHVLTHAERDVLLEPGPDYPYAVVSAVPNGLSADMKLAAVEMLDVGDPGTVTTVDVGAEPTALAADGQRFYVATTGGEVVVFDRTGDQQARFAIGGNVSSGGHRNGVDVHAFFEYSPRVSLDAGGVVVVRDRDRVVYELLGVVGLVDSVSPDVELGPI